MNIVCLKFTKTDTRGRQEYNLTSEMSSDITLTVQIRVFQLSHSEKKPTLAPSPNNVNVNNVYWCHYCKAVMARLQSQCH